MSEMDVELRTAEACRAALARRGIRYRAATMVLFAMVENDIIFDDALKVWADYEDIGEGGKWPPERWRSEICYRLLKAWILEPPAQWFELLAEEVRRRED